MRTNVPAASTRENTPLPTASDGKAVKDQRGRVIGKAFPFEHDDEPAQNAQPANDGERRNYVGRRLNGAEHETDGKRNTEQPVRHCCHRTGGEDDTTDRQQRDRPQIETKLAPAHGDPRRVDQRRQDPEQYQFGGELYPREAGNEGKPDAGDDKKDRGSGVEPPCDNGYDEKHRN
jgi:hypothetical protein